MVIQLGNKNSDFGLSRAYLYAYRLGILSVFILFLLGTHLLLPISVDTNSAEGAALPSTTELAINTDYSSANLDFTTISSTGTFASSSAEDIAKFTVTTNNYTGYTLTLAGNDDTGQLNNISAGAALDSIATSGIESSSFSTNEWGYLPSKYNSEANTTKYYSAPTTSDADTLDVTNAANASNTPNEYTISLGAKVDYSKPAGTYTNTFILAAVGNPVSYSVNYLDNTGDPTVDNMPNAQASTTTATSITLAPYGSTTPDPADVPTRTDYRFLGWCDVATTNDGKDCSGNMLQTGDTISIDQTSTNVTNLYAVWKSTIINYIQNWASCSTLNTGDTITLTDKRDNEEYLVGKLADGNCWLLDNMRLDLTAVDLDNQDKTGLVGNTNANATTLGYLKNGGGSSPNPAAGVSSQSGKWYYTYNEPYIATSGLDGSSGWTKDTVAETKYGLGSGKIGVYYNFCAASAGSYCYEYGYYNNDSITQDICPAGWKIPTADSSGQYENLAGFYTNTDPTKTNSLQYNLSTPLSGRFGIRNTLVYEGPIDQYNIDGGFWGSTYYNNYSRNTLQISASSVGASSYEGVTAGLPIRCVQKGDTENAISGMTMQEIGSLSMSDYNDLLGSMEEGKAYTTSDVRDGEQYKIAKLKDGNVWLLDNLRLDPVTVPEATLKGNTNATDQSIACLKNGAIGTTGCSGQYASNPVSSNASFTYDNKAVVMLASKDSTATFAGLGSGKIGVYYNYCAASAGSYCYSGSSTDYTDASQDICPIGWKMPTGDKNKGSYYYLYNTSYNSNTYNFRYALSLPFSGYYYSGAGQVNTAGYFWSSTFHEASQMNYLNVNISNVGAESYISRTYGLTVRCILREPADKGISNMTMQDIGNMNASDYSDLLNSMVEEKAYTVPDARDGEQYKIAKLKDGNIWMLDNMRLDLTSVSLATLKGNTNATDQTLTYLKNGGGSSPYSISGVSSTWTSSNQDSYNSPYIATSGLGWTKDTTTTSYGNGSGKIGIYYNYCAASAGSYCYASGIGSGNTLEDICPVGWKMPNGDQRKGSYYYLYNNTTEGYSANATSFRTALSTPLSGNFGSGSAVNQGGAGNFWSSAFAGSSLMYYLYVYSSGANPQSHSDGRHSGFSVRCRVKTASDMTINDVDTMQDLGTLSADGKTAIVNSMITGRAYIVNDSRDNQSYTIAKLKDGKIWMIDNLNLGDTDNYPLVVSNLDSTNTHLASDASPISAADFSSTWKKTEDSSSYVLPIYIALNGVDSTNGAKYGTLYNYCAASAQTVCAYWPDTATGDVCPAGWRLPTGDESDGEFKTLYNNYGSSSNMRKSLSDNGASFAFAGTFITSSAPSNQDVYGYYWSSSPPSSSAGGHRYNMYSLYMDASSVTTSYSYTRTNGGSIRCVLD